MRTNQQADQAKAACNPEISICHSQNEWSANMYSFSPTFLVYFFLFLLFFSVNPLPVSRYFSPYRLNPFMTHSFSNSPSLSPLLVYLFLLLCLLFSFPSLTTFYLWGLPVGYYPLFPSFFLTFLTPTPMYAVTHIGTRMAQKESCGRPLRCHVSALKLFQPKLLEYSLIPTCKN